MGGARPGDERQADKACAFATEAFVLDKHYFDKSLERNTHPLSVYRGITKELCVGRRNSSRSFRWKWKWKLEEGEFLREK